MIGSESAESARRLKGRSALIQHRPYSEATKAEMIETMQHHRRLTTQGVSK
jgi:hypothetical protein